MSQGVLLLRILYHHPLCPYARQVRLALAEKRLDFSLERERPPASSSVDTWPVMTDLTGVVVSHPCAIIEYLEDMYPERPLWPADMLIKADARRLVGWATDILGRDVSGALLFEKYGKRVEKKGVPDSTTIRQAKAKLVDYLAILAHLIERRHWLAGEQMTYADLAVAAHLSIVDYLGDIDWDKHNTMKEWYVRLKSRPSFRPILADRIGGLHPAAHYDDLDF